MKKKMIVAKYLWPPRPNGNSEDVGSQTKQKSTVDKVAGEKT